MLAPITESDSISRPPLPTPLGTNSSSQRPNAYKHCAAAAAASKAMAATAHTSAQLLQTIGDLLQEAKPVSYKWLAREYALPANYAKQLLFRFAQERGGSVLALYAVAGAPKAAGGDDAGAVTAIQPSHVVRLVPAAQLEACCKQLQQHTLSVHVHR